MSRYRVGQGFEQHMYDQDQSGSYNHEIILLMVVTSTCLVSICMEDSAETNIDNIELNS